MINKKQYKFSCKEENCPEEVVYIPNDPRYEIPATRIPEITVYLTCRNGHTHRYQINGEPIYE